MKMNNLQIKINEAKQVLSALEQQKYEIERREREELIDKIKREYRLKPEHLVLLKEMEFRGIFYGDIVSIGADGKRPFGNSYVYQDIARILKWKLPNDDLSNEQLDNARTLLAELPYALNEIIKNA